MGTTMTASLPTRERGLKQKHGHGNPRLHRSLPTRERGLKRLRPLPGGCDWASLPTRERGLKLFWFGGYFSATGRSPRGSVD